MLYVEKRGSPYHLPLPPEDANLDEVVLRHLEGIWQRELPRATGPQFNHLAVVAAGLLTFGRLERADYVLENLPPHRIEMDMFAGWGNVFVAAGHFRAGVQLSIGTAQAVADLFTGRPPCVPLEAFRLDRTPEMNQQQVFRS